MMDITKLLEIEQIITFNQQKEGKFYQVRETFQTSGLWLSNLLDKINRASMNAYMIYHSSCLNGVERIEQMGDGSVLLKRNSAN